MTRRIVAVVALAACLLLLPGCAWLLGPAVAGGGIGARTSADEETATANVRASIPAMEAYFADHGSYAGATLAALRTYDHAIADVGVFPAADGMTYCIESTVGSVTVSRPGPAGEFRPGPCRPLEATPSSTDAEEAVRAVVPLLEVYYAQHGTFAGVRGEVRRGTYGSAFRDVRVIVRPGGLGYCVEAPATAASAHFEGSRGVLASGPCPATARD